MEKLTKIYPFLLTAAFLSITTFFISIHLLNEEFEPEPFVCGVEAPPGCGTAFIIKNQTGQTLFENNCKTCHAIDKVVVGPALRGVDKRRPKEWIYSFVNNSQKVIQSKDPYALQLFEEFNRAEMKSFPELSHAEIDSIIDFINGY